MALTSLFFISVKSQFKNLTESVSAPWQMYFHDPETPIMEGIINFHDKAMCLITFIVFAVGYAMLRCVFLFENKNDNRAYEKFIQGTARRAILPALVLLNLRVPSIALLEGASQGTIVKIVTKDPTFSDTFYSSDFLPELKSFLVENINTAYIFPLLFLVVKYSSIYYKSKPKPPSDPGSESKEEGSPVESKAGSEGVALDTVEIRTADLLDYSGDSCSEFSLFSVKDLWGEDKPSNPTPSFGYAQEALGEEEKASDPFTFSDDLDSTGGFESLWEDKLIAILDEASSEKRNSLIAELLENPESSVQITLIGELVDSYASSITYILYAHRIEDLSFAFTFCNNFTHSQVYPVLGDDAIFIETFTNSFLLVSNIF